jgi:hypothetical protein
MYGEITPKSTAIISTYEHRAKGAVKASKTALKIAKNAIIFTRISRNDQ